MASKRKIILAINTASISDIVLQLKDGERVIARRKLAAPRRQAEKLLPAIDSLLAKNGLALADLLGLEVVISGGTFTSLRIGVLTANALAFALKIQIVARDEEGRLVPANLKSAAGLTIAVPRYNAEPNIGKKK